MGIVIVVALMGWRVKRVGIVLIRYVRRAIGWKARRRRRVVRGSGLKRASIVGWKYR